MRADALEQQIEVQKMKFEQQMQQSALAMEELFDQLAGVRKEKDMAMQALQKALAAQQGLAAPAASAMALDGSAPEGAIPEESGKALLELEALHEVRLKAAKDTNEELQLENGHLREECDRLRSENMKLQAVVTSIKQLILGEPAALSAHVLPTASTPAARADSTLVLMPVHEEDEGAAASPIATTALMSITQKESDSSQPQSQPESQPQPQPESQPQPQPPLSLQVASRSSHSPTPESVFADPGPQSAIAADAAMPSPLEAPAAPPASEGQDEASGVAPTLASSSMVPPIADSSAAPAEADSAGASVDGAGAGAGPSPAVDASKPVGAGARAAVEPSLPCTHEPPDSQDGQTADSEFPLPEVTCSIKTTENDQLVVSFSWDDAWASEAIMRPAVV